MSESDGAPKAKRGLIVGTIGIIALIGASIIGHVIGRSGGEIIGRAGRAAFTSVEAWEQEIDRLSNDPANTSLAAVRIHFPEDYARFRTAVAKAAKSDMTNAEVGVEAFKFMRAFTLSHIEHAAAAPEGPMVSLAAANLNLVEVLQDDNVQACADFGMSGLNPSVRLSPDSIMALDAVSAKTIEAARAGIDHPVVRATDLSRTDWQELGSAMRSNGTPDEVMAALVDLSKQSPEIQCEATVALYKATTALSPERGAKVTASALTAAKRALSSPS